MEEGSFEEESWRRHLGSIWELSGRHLGETWGHLVVPGDVEASGSQLRSFTCVLSAKVARPTISHTRDELNLHVDGKFTATLRGHEPGADPGYPSLGHKTCRQKPYSGNTVWVINPP